MSTLSQDSATNDPAVAPKTSAPDTASLEGMTARIRELLLQRKFTEAEPLCKRVLAIQEKRLGAEHPDLAIALHDLGTVYHRTALTAPRRYRDAVNLFRRALRLQAAAESPHPLIILKSLSSLGLLYYSQKRFRDAEKLFREALTICEAERGVDDPFVGMLLSLIGRSLQKRQHYAKRSRKEAQALFERALRIRQQAFGEKHVIVSKSHNDLGVLMGLERKYPEAQAYFDTALAIREHEYGDEHRALVILLKNLECLFGCMGEKERAAMITGRLHRIDEITLLHKLLALYRDIDKPEKIAEVTERIKEVRQSNLPGTVVDFLKKYSRKERSRKRKARLERTREIKSLQNIEVMYRKQGKTESITRIRARLRPVREMHALEIMRDFYLHTGRDEMVEEIEDQLDQLREERAALRASLQMNKIKASEEAAKAEQAPPLDA